MRYTAFFKKRELRSHQVRCGLMYHSKHLGSRRLVLEGRGWWMFIKNYTSSFAYTKTFTTLEHIKNPPFRAHILYTQIQLLIMKTAFLWHLLKMFASETWKIPPPIRVWNIFQTPLLGQKTSNHDNFKNHPPPHQY